MNLVIWALLPLAVVLLYAGLTLHRMLTSVIRDAGCQFFDSMSKMLETPQDIPIDVLQVMRAMNADALSGRGASKVIAALRSTRKGENAPRLLAIDDMRKELKHLFATMIISWMILVAARNPLKGAVILFYMNRLAVKRIDKLRDADEMALGVAPLVA